MPDNIIRLSISEAAKLFGVNQTTIRRALKRQDLRYIVVQNRYKINFESLVEWSQNRQTIKNKMNNKGIGQFVDRWKIRNLKFSPQKPKNPEN
jgi:excisionase family DNA binding protein